MFLIAFDIDHWYSDEAFLFEHEQNMYIEDVPIARQIFVSGVYNKLCQANLKQTSITQLYKTL